MSNPKSRGRWTWAVGTGVVTLYHAIAGTDALGHGGQYRGPYDRTSKAHLTPGDVLPPGNPGGPGAPGFRILDRPKRGPVTGGFPAYRGRTMIDTFPDRWEFWWEHNKAPLLDVRRRVRERLATQGAVDEARPVWPSGDEIEEVLLQQLTEEQADIVDSALLALARSYPREADGEPIIEVFVDALDDRRVWVRQAACLSLGVLGRNVDPVLSVLRALLADSAEGRKLVGSKEVVPFMVQAFAAASLGLIGNPVAIDDLKRAATDRTKGWETRAMATHSLGLMPDGHEDIVPCLLRILVDQEEEELVRAQAPIALGKLHLLHGGSSHARESVAQLVSLLREPDLEPLVRDSVVIALGMLGEMGDDDVLEALQQSVRSGTRRQTLHFSVMALAQIGGRDRSPDRHETAHARLEAFLVEVLQKSKIASLWPFASLGLGLYARNPRLSPAVAERIGAELLEAFRRWNNTSNQAAVAISLGLLGHQPAREVLAAKLETMGDQRARGYIVLALAMVGGPYHEKFRAIVTNDDLAYQLRLQAIHALALLGDADAIDDLQAVIQKSWILDEGFAATQAVGSLAQRGDLERLSEVASDPAAIPLVRGLGCIALGLAASRDHLPWNWVFAANSNYRAKFSALAEILDLL